MLQSKAGYIDARPHIPQLEEVLLQRTAGPYIRVTSGGGNRRGRSTDVRFASNNDRIDASQRTVALCHVWTAPSWQGFSSRLQVGRCSHVFGLLARHTGRWP
jgi:hypothetical protein